MIWTIARGTRTGQGTQYHSVTGEMYINMRKSFQNKTKINRFNSETGGGSAEKRPTDGPRHSDVLKCGLSKAG